jgi:hypothetical protein
MAQAIALYRERIGAPLDLLHSGVVVLCALVLIAAGRALPF